MEGFIAALVALTVFIIIILIVVLVTPESIKLSKNDKTENLKVYDKLFKKSPDVVAHKMGIATDKYVFNCNILGVEPNIERVILLRILAVLILLFGSTIPLFAGLSLVPFSLLIISITTSIIVFIAPTVNIQNKAKERQAQFESEIPRFLDLFQTALKINLPVPTAIKITAESIDGVLSEELLKALVINQVGSGNWQDALYDIAQRYEVDVFSEFVLDLVSAFQKGSSITETVEMQSRNIKTSSLLKAKESAARITSLVLIPVVIFKALPLMAILFLPIYFQLQGGVF